VKSIVDAQLPRRLARELSTLGADAVHTLDLPAANRTPDGEVRRVAEAGGRVVVGIDGDFVGSFLLHRAPPNCEARSWNLCALAARLKCNRFLDRFCLRFWVSFDSN
jgi:predicted nuclease of predicted toxin-antitoxin system